MLLKPISFFGHRPERLVDTVFYGKTDTKRLRFVHPSAGMAANIVLIEGTKGGRAKLLLEPPLYVRDENNNYTFEIEKIYGRI